MSKNTNKTKAKLDVNKYLLTQARPAGLLFMAPALLFTAFTILIVRMYVYYRPMSQFFWTPHTDDTQQTEFFSHYKAVFIIVMACIAAFFLIFRLLYKNIRIKYSPIYIPMIVYSLFVFLSYLASDYKEFALMGYNERFEGTIPLLCYMVMLFYIINTVNTEKDVKQIIWPLAITSVILGLLGLSQSLDHDFFRTKIGQMLISPNLQLSDGTTIWQGISEAFEQGELFFNFTFQNKEIYQTVYNINYVSFYLTLLVPIWGMLFVRAWDKQSGEKLWKKIVFACLFALCMYNFVGSKSAGGVIGIGVIGILGIVIINKQLLKMWKPLAVLFAITGFVLAITTSYWLPEIQGTLEGTFGIGAEEETEEELWVDYLRTTDNSVEISINGEGLSFVLDTSDYSVAALDADGNQMSVIARDDGLYAFQDERFADKIYFGITSDEENTPYIILQVNEIDMFFLYDGSQILYRNDYGNTVALVEDVPHDTIFDSRMGFGSGRGYIWSRSIPLLKNTLLLGYGPDTYCVVFPQGDYAGRLNWGGDTAMSIIVDKPHNMYLNVGIGSGCVALIALIAVYAIYFIQSIKLYWKKIFAHDYLINLGFGIFVGVAGFAFTGIVDDSTVSVMPMFYGLLGLGIAINMIIKARGPQTLLSEKESKQANGKE